MEQLLFKSASPDDENRRALAQQLKEREADLLMRATKKSAGAPLTNLAGKIFGKKQATGTTFERVSLLTRVAENLHEDFFVTALRDRKSPAFIRAVERLEKLVKK
jgi:hypothetical protein